VQILCEHEMSGEHEIDKSFPYFEEHNFSGLLMLRELDCDEVIETPIPKDVDANGHKCQGAAGTELSGRLKNLTRLLTQGSRRPAD
jgi:hypothetical protein